MHVGALAYPTSGVESGWIAAPVPAIYTSPDLAGYRKHLGLYSFEGQNPLYGSFFSDSIEDYYVSPYELGYGRSISFGHDFIGRDALLKTKDSVRRTKVTPVFDPADTALAIAPGQELALSNGRYRVESGGALAGQAYHTASLAPANAVLSLAVIDTQYAAPGTGVTVSWGEHPGHGTAPDADLGFPRIRATVAPAPYSAHARTSYRAAGLTGAALPAERTRARLPRPGRIGDDLQGGQGGVPLGRGQAAGHRLVDLLDNAGCLEVPVAAFVGDLQQDGPAAPLGLALGHPAKVAQMTDGERGALRGDADDPCQVGDRAGTARHELAGQADLRHRDVELGEPVVESAPEHQVSTPDQVADAIAGPGVRGRLRRARQGLPGLSVGHGQESTTLRTENKYLAITCEVLVSLLA